MERTLWPASSPDLNPAEPLVGSAYAVHAGVTETTALADLHEKSWGLRNGMASHSQQAVDQHEEEEPGCLVLRPKDEATYRIQQIKHEPRVLFFHTDVRDSSKQWSQYQE